MKNKILTIIFIAASAASLLTLWALADKVNAFVKEKYIVPIIDCRIDDKQRFNNEKLDVLYMYTMESAKKNGSAALWDKCVDHVQGAGKVRRMRNK